MYSMKAFEKEWQTTNHIIMKVLKGLDSSIRSEYDGVWSIQLHAHFPVKKKECHSYFFPLERFTDKFLDVMITAAPALHHESEGKRIYLPLIAYSGGKVLIQYADVDGHGADDESLNNICDLDEESIASTYMRFLATGGFFHILNRTAESDTDEELVSKAYALDIEDNRGAVVHYGELSGYLTK